jgi:hypothetical protein
MVLHRPVELAPLVGMWIATPGKFQGNIEVDWAERAGPPGWNWDATTAE